MRRIKITLRESRRGWRCEIQRWDTQLNGYYYRTGETLKKHYGTAGDILNILALREGKNEEVTQGNFLQKG
jgi:hypothetical protein